MPGLLVSKEATFLTFKLQFVFVEFDYFHPGSDHEVYHICIVLFLCSSAYKCVISNAGDPFQAI